jgi:hypothetical protein
MKYKFYTTDKTEAKRIVKALDMAIALLRIKRIKAEGNTASEVINEINEILYGLNIDLDDIIE